MKRLFFFLAAIVFCVNGWSIEEQIILYPDDDKADISKDNRSSSIAPTASHDDNVITIYSGKTLEDVGIYVVDVHGGILYSAEESTLVGNYTFALNGNPKGTLMLVIQTSEGYYEGEFSIE